MKKSLVLIISVLLVLVFALAGCSSGVKDTTVANTKKVWNDTENKVAEDTIIVKDFNIAGLIILDNAKINLKREFSKDQVVLTFNIDELKVTFGSNFTSILSVIKGVVDNFPNINTDTIEENIDKVKLNGTLKLTNNKTKLAIDLKTKGIRDILPGLVNENPIVNTVVDLNYGPKDAFSEAIKLGIDLALSHYSSIFEPNKDETASLNKEPLNEILRAVVKYSEDTYGNKPSEGYKPISQIIKNIAGIEYNRLINEKINVTSGTSKCEVEDDFITKMDITLSKIQLLYNQNEVIKLIQNAAKELNLSSDITNLIPIIKPFILEVTKGVSCVEIGSIQIVSNYTLK